MTDLREKKRTAFFRGHSAERFASVVLLLKGFRVVARRYRTRLGEIDLIARRGDLVLIVEVKARNSLEAAQLAVTPQAMHRIEAAADLWLQRPTVAAFRPDRRAAEAVAEACASILHQRQLLISLCKSYKNCRVYLPRFRE